MEYRHSKYCHCLYYSANALARVLTKLAEDEFASTGLAPSYAFLLMTVNDEPGIQPKEISEHMQLTPSTVTRLIEKMEHKGLLERKSLGKFTRVYPTEKSKALDKKFTKLGRVFTSAILCCWAKKKARDLQPKYMRRAKVWKCNFFNPFSLYVQTTIASTHGG